ncbi:MAG: dynamin family protein [Dermatophilaceae bacterium]
MSANSLDRALGDLLPLCDPERAAKVHDLTSRLALGQVRVLLVGEAKRGKSTLGNALLGREILPTGVTPLTSISTTITAGSPEHIDVGCLDGRSEHAPLTALADYVTESGNPANAKRVDQVTVVLETDLPAPGMVLVDTPGFGSVFAHNSAQAQAALGRMDLAVFVLTADPPISASEASLLKEVQQRAVATFVVLNKADRLAPTELVDTLAFLRSVIPGVDVLPCSAREGLTARLVGQDTAYTTSGMRAVVDTITHRLAAHGRQDLDASIAAASRRIVDSLADETDVTQAALDAQSTARREQVAAFGRTLQALPRIARQATSRVEWLLDELHRDLIAAASVSSAALTRQARAAVEELLTVPDRSVKEVGHLRGAGEQRLQGMVRDGVISWQEECGTRVTDRLQQIVADEQHHLSDAIHSVRDSSERDLGIRLRLPPLTVALPEQRLFRFDFTDPVGWDVPLAVTLRRHAPAPIARRQIAKDLRRRASDLPDKHLGRARYDLDQRLAEAGRSLTSVVASAYHDLGHGLTNALDAADTATGRPLADIVSQQRMLLNRQRLLADIADALNRIGHPRRETL